MAVSVLPSQRGTASDVPLPYTASPLQLLWSDVLLFFRSLWSLPGIVFPLCPYPSGELDELYPSAANLFCVAVHTILVLFQLAFLLSLPVCVVCMVPALWVAAYVGVVLGVNWVVCRVTLNGGHRFLESRVPVEVREGHEKEHWVFVNGVAVGHHWLQSNIDRLAYTFGRKVTGVHNPTTGIIFDTIQCLIQRNFSYATQDVRNAYALIKASLLDAQYDKIVLILHSQGGIEGGLIIDWLLDEMPQDLLATLEVYTFGNAANHFNNPHRRLTKEVRRGKDDNTANNGHSRRKESDGKAISYIEHYANSKDFVSVWGVLNFINVANRYMGPLFVRPGSGHQFNQHYLDTMFTLGPDMKVLEHNAFMDMEAEITASGALRAEQLDGVEDGGGWFCSDDDDDDDDEKNLPQIFDANSPVSLVADGFRLRPGRKVKDFSRLWLYRNGRVVKGRGRK